MSVTTRFHDLFAEFAGLRVEVDRLRAENERLKSGLKEICNMNSGEGRDSCLMQEVAEDALRGEGE